MTFQLLNLLCGLLKASFVCKPGLCSHKTEEQNPAGYSKSYTQSRAVQYSSSAEVTDMKLR